MLQSSGWFLKPDRHSPHDVPITVRAASEYNSHPPVQVGRTPGSDLADYDEQNPEPYERPVDLFSPRP